jgi:hypothetical protein
MLGTVPAVVSSWSDPQVVATVASGAMTGSARVQQNGIWSNSIRFIVPTNGSGGNNVTIVPSLASMLIGQTRGLQALNASGAPIAGLTWNSSDSTVVSLSTDDPPIMTALAAGRVTITAGDASADVSVYSGYSLPTGTVIWSAPGDGSGVSKILPAVPSLTGVADVFAVQNDGTVQAITSDGAVAWTASVGQANLIPDFQGGLVTSSGSAGGLVTRLDGMAGQATPLYTYAQGQEINVAVHTDGTIFTFDGGTLVGIDPASGVKFTIPTENNTYQWQNACGGQIQEISSPALILSNLVIAGDGYAYAFYEYYQYSDALQWGTVGCDETQFWQVHDRLLQVASNGTYQEIVIGDWSQANTAANVQSPSGGEATQSGNAPEFQTAALATNADAGVVLTLDSTFGAYCSYSLFPGPTTTSGCVPEQDVHQLLTISGGNVVSTATLPNSYPADSDSVIPVLQAQDGTYFGTGATSPGSMDAFDTSANVKWSVPGGYTPVMATADGGLIAQSATGQYVTFDQNGVADGMLASLPAYSWVGNLYNSPGPTLDLTSLLPPPDPDDSFATFQGGNPSGTATSVRLERQRIFVPAGMFTRNGLPSQPDDANWVSQVYAKMGPQDSPRRAILDFKMYYNQGNLPDELSFLNALAVTNTVVGGEKWCQEPFCHRRGEMVSGEKCCQEPFCHRGKTIGCEYGRNGARNGS